jgi:hypothetical protein
MCSPGGQQFGGDAAGRGMRWGDGCEARLHSLLSLPPSEGDAVLRESWNAQAYHGHGRCEEMLDCWALGDLEKRTTSFRDRVRVGVSLLSCKGILSCEIFLRGDCALGRYSLAVVC